jgi:hypothetical protein
MKYSGYVVLNTKNKAKKFLSDCGYVSRTPFVLFHSKKEADIYLEDELAWDPSKADRWKVVPAHVIVKEK